MFDLTGKRALVTGASGGIGRSLAETFAAEGASLALTGHAKYEELARWLSDQPWRDRAIALKADVAEPDQLEIAMSAAVEKFGRVDVCVANAGKWPPPSLRLDEIEVARVRDTVNVNMYGALWTARAPRKRPQKSANGSVAFGGRFCGLAQPATAGLPRRCANHTSRPRDGQRARDSPGPRRS